MSHSQFSPVEPPRDTSIKRMLPAWLTSMVFHCLLLILLIFGIRSIPRGAVEEPDRTTGIVLKRVTQTGEYYEGENTNREFSSDAANATDSRLISSALPGEEEAPFDATTFLPDASDGVGSPGASTAGGGRLSLEGRGEGEKNLDGGKARTGVFGLTGEGYKFVYVFDISSSMNAYGGRPLDAAKRELIHSLKSLGALHQFQIIFYNEYEKLFNPTLPGKLFFATEPNKEAAETFINRIKASGTTRHLEPLLKAVSLGGENIFFLTDGTDPSLNQSQLLRIRRRNGGRSAIHVIQFGTEPQPGDNWLKKLARQNGGEYRFFRIDRLSPKNIGNDC